MYTSLTLLIMRLSWSVYS